MNLKQPKLILSAPSYTDLVFSSWTTEFFCLNTLNRSKQIVSKGIFYTMGKTEYYNHPFIDAAFYHQQNTLLKCSHYILQ